MAETPKYAEERANKIVLLTRDVLKELPALCFDYINAIENATQPLTRYVYACDLKLFFHYLAHENSMFCERAVYNWSQLEFRCITARDVQMYMNYLNYYVKDDLEYSNSEAGKMRKLSSLRSFFQFLYKNGVINADVTELVDMPKIHAKPILRMEIDEVSRMLDLVETGEGMDKHQKAYNNNTKQRDLTILTLFLGTGIRVSELVGIDLDDVDLLTNSFLVTRKGGNQVVLYFPDEVADVLRAYIEKRNSITALPGHERALFLSLQKKRITVRGVEYLVKKYATQAAPLKKRLSPHKLRSTFGTNLYNETGDIYLVADVLGHEDVNTTKKHYADMSEARRKMAASKVHIRESVANALDEATEVTEATEAPEETKDNLQ